MKISNPEKELLSKSHPASRYWLLKQIEKGALSDDTKRQLHLLNFIEGNIYKQWRENCLQDMKRIKLHNCLPDVFAFISQPDVSLAKALAFVRRKYAKETNKSTQKQLGKVILLLQRLANSESMLYQEAKKHLDSNNLRQAIEKIAKSIEKQDEIRTENLLFLKQSIKHYLRILKLGVTPDIAELAICLKTDFSSDNNIFTKQVDIVYSTYHPGEDVPADIKDICFNFIKASIEKAGYFHANLINYIFKNDEISERAFQLFCDTEKMIKATGMSSLPRTYAARLAKNKGLYNKPASDLSDSDIRILRIERMFA